MVNGESFCDQSAGCAISNTFERSESEEETASGSNFQADKSPRDRSIAPNEIHRVTQRRSSGFNCFDRKVSLILIGNSSDYVDSYESTAIFHSQDSPHVNENFARSRDGNWDRPVKDLFDDREREIFKILVSVTRNEVSRSNCKNLRIVLGIREDSNSTARRNARTLSDDIAEKFRRIRRPSKVLP